ncbi:hypothetical protein ACWGPQ_10450 [Saccharomonospora azurea]
MCCSAPAETRHDRPNQFHDGLTTCDRIDVVEDHAVELRQHSLGSQASAAVGGGMSATALVATALLAMGVLLTLAAARQTRQ